MSNLQNSVLKALGVKTIKVTAKIMTVQSIANKKAVLKDKDGLTTIDANSYKIGDRIALTAEGVIIGKTAENIIEFEG